MCGGITIVLIPFVLLSLTGEFLFMAFSIYICYRARSAPSNYGEVRLITLAIYNETLISAAFYITRSAQYTSFHAGEDYILRRLREDRERTTQGADV